MNVFWSEIRGPAEVELEAWFLFPIQILACLMRWIQSNQMWSLCNICWLYWRLCLQGISTWGRVWIMISNFWDLSNLGYNCLGHLEEKMVCVHMPHGRLQIHNWIILQAWIWIFLDRNHHFTWRWNNVWYNELSTSRGPSALSPHVPVSLSQSLRLY